jgi:alpha-L-rhamnosidase
MNKLNIIDLRCEYTHDPIGIAESRPRLFWRLDGDHQAIRQSRYWIQAAVQPEHLESPEGPLLADTGWIESDTSAFVEYPGEPVKPRERVYWRVKTADTQGNESEFSAPAFFERTLAHWDAQWISSPLVACGESLRPVPLLRREFTLSKEIARARLYSSARGVYLPHVNGVRLDEYLLHPGCTNYHQRILFQTFDITPYLKVGKNCLGAELSTGWYVGNYGYEGLYNIYGDTVSFIGQLHVEYCDGTEDVLCTDHEWTTSLGPIEYSDLYYGELYDARKEQPGWDMADFDAASWIPVCIQECSYDQLTAHDGEMIRRIMEIPPREIITSPRGDMIIDMGQNMVGWLRVRLSGSPGDIFSCEFAEVLDMEGEFYTENLRIEGMKDTYIMNGGGLEIFEPSFTFHGFRYVRILNYSGTLSLDDITGVVVHSDMEQTGTFSCSDPLINQLQHNIEWGQRGNFLDIPTDCPQRDERLGWTGDAQVFIKTGSFNFNVARFFTKWLRDVASEQREDGNIPVVIPNVLGGQNHPPFGSAAWGDAVIICPLAIYKTYGDIGLLAEHYPMMQAWNEYVKSKTVKWIWKNDFHFGDWLALDQPPDSPSCFGGTDREQVATAFFAYATSLLQEVAGILGDTVAASAYEQQYHQIRTAFRNEFVTPSGRVGSNTQTSYVHALMFDLLLEEDRAEAARRLVEDIQERGWHLSTGFTGTPYLLHVLSRFGYEEAAYRLLLQKEYPSWLYSVTKGATTIWERWDGIRPDGSFQTPGMNSFNHYAYGAVGDWMYPHILGFFGDAGFRTLTFTFPEQCPFEHAEGSFMTLYGVVVSNWKKIGDEALWEIAIPTNSKGLLQTVYAHYESVEFLEPANLQIPCDLIDDRYMELGSGTFVLRLTPGGEG